MTEAVIYSARRIHTQDPALGVATHVAVRDGLIAGAGSLADLRAIAGLETARVDERFSDKVILPGFIEGHAHLDGGTVWRSAYLGAYDRTDPDGKVWPGVLTIEAVVERLKQHLDATGKASGWGFDPLLIGAALDRHDLDAVSDVAPVVVFHASGHIMVCNTAALKEAGLFPPKSTHPGLPLGEDGAPIGELRGAELMGMAIRTAPSLRSSWTMDGRGALPFSRTCVRVGVTTSTDLANGLGETALANLTRVSSDDDFPLRLVPVLLDNAATPKALVERALELRSRSSERLRLGAIKIVLDGSIQGFTARLLSGTYYNGAPNGLWYQPPERLEAVFKLALDQGVQVHTHTNGDEATELVLETLERLLEGRQTGDHGFVLQHAQLIGPQQLQRAAALGVQVNLFPNHIFYWGDAHKTLTVGPERVAMMNPCRAALDAGVTLAIHSDDPVTPIAPLFTAWCAVNRISATGEVLGPDQRISVAEALYAITMGAARTLKLDAEIGSITPGKKADFAILETDPMEIDPIDLRSVPVWGTVSSGRIFEAAHA